ncbi:hypothetical protein M9434_001883 [Picochlorum sp. BPE23]|nr:hypothetical protein M9434_001883 [Picochlorum sp. BPE23]
MPRAVGQECEFESFLDAIPGDIFGDTSIFKTAIKISGYQDKLPSPKSDVSITLLVPTNGAWLRMLWDNGLFIPIISKVGDALPATVLYNTMLGTVSPDQIQQFSKENPGSSPSIYGLLSGKPGYNIQYWSAEKDDKTAYYFSPEGTLNDGVAETFRPVQVCNSWIYFTNKVLIPTQNGKLGDVEKVSIPENLPWEQGSSSPKEDPAPAAAAPAAEEAEIPAILPPRAAAPLPDEIAIPIILPAAAPAQNKDVCLIPDPDLIAGPPQAVAPAAEIVTGEAPLARAPAAEIPSVELPIEQPTDCNTTFADEARKAGLGILATALSQESIKNQLPDPSESNTLFAPIDNAFFTVLTDLGISITDALALGDKLAGVILYHVHPDEALSLDQVRERQTLTTELGLRLNEPDKYVIGVQSDQDSTRLTSLRPGDIATITQELQVCSTSILVIDKVLLPAENVNSLPDPGQAPVVTNRQLEVPQQPELISVDSPRAILDGGIAFATGPLQGCSITLEAEGTTLTATTDTDGRFTFEGIPQCAIETGIIVLPKAEGQQESCIDSATRLPPPYALVADLYNLMNNLTSTPSVANPLNLSPLSTLLSSATLGSSSANGVSHVTNEIAALLGLKSQEEAVMSPGRSSNMNLLSANSQSLVTSLLGGTTLKAFLANIVNLEEGVLAIDNVIASKLQDKINLSDPSQVQSIIQEAMELFSNGPALSSRKLRQDTIPPEYLSAISQSIAEVNRISKSVVYDNSIPADRRDEVLSNCTAVSQTSIAPAIEQLGAGELSLSDFQSNYNPSSIASMIGYINVPSPSPELADPTTEPATVVAQQSDSAIPMIPILTFILMQYYIM